VQFAEAFFNVGEPLGDEVGDVPAGRVAAVAHAEDLADLPQGESGGLGVADERHAVGDLGWVVAVAGWGALWLGEQPLVFVEAQGLGGYPGGRGQLTDPHCPPPVSELLTFQCAGRSTVLPDRSQEGLGMQVTLLYFDRCPNWHTAEAHVRAALRRLGRGDVAVTRRPVETAEQAEAVGFRGSPTVLVDGRDPFADPQAPVGLSCRVYTTPEGLAGAPTVAQLVDVLA
jgi:hypothetical protein